MDPSSETDAGTETSEIESGRSAFVTMIGALLIVLVLLVLTLPLTIPIFATITYRSAVSSLHSELRPVFPDSAQLIDEKIDGCWNGAAPASVRTFVPRTGGDDSDLRALAHEIRTAIDGAGFSSGQSGWLTRERDDAFDMDVVVVEVVNNQVQVVADVYDADSVFCFPG